MTDYEILDLRATYGERLTSMSKFWLTLTFAVFGGGYYLQDHPDLFSKLALFIFYGITSLLSCQTMISINQFIAGLSDRIQNGRAETENTILVAKELNVGKATKTVRFFVMLAAVTFLALGFYLFRN